LRQIGEKLSEEEMDEILGDADTNKDGKARGRSATN